MKSNTFFCYHLELRYKGIYSHEDFQQTINFLRFVDDLDMVSVRFIIGNHNSMVSDNKKVEQAMQDLLKIWNLLDQEIVYNETVDSNWEPMINIKLPDCFKVRV